MNEQTSEIIAGAMFETDEAFKLDSMTQVEGLFDDNPDKGYTGIEIMEITCLSRPAVNSRLAELKAASRISIVERQPVTSGGTRAVYKKSKTDTASIIKALWV